MDLEFNGRVALVTGSSRGIGFSIASSLQDEGCRVILNGRSESPLRSAASALQVPYLVGDVVSASGASNVANAARKIYGELDILVCNVGSGISVSPGEETLAEWQRVMAGNLYATTNMVAAARPHLKDGTNAAILCISSICGCEALGAPIAYSAAKAALNSFVVGSARYLAGENIRINALAPGNILFPGSRWQAKIDQDEAGVTAMLRREVALARFGTVAEVAAMATFLCSSRAAFATGHIYVLDGGQLRH